MTEVQKQERLVHLKEHYQTTLKEWTELEELLIRGHPEGAESLPTSPEAILSPKTEEHMKHDEHQVLVCAANFFLENLA